MPGYCDLGEEKVERGYRSIITHCGRVISLLSIIINMLCLYVCTRYLPNVGITATAEYEDHDPNAKKKGERGR